MSMRAGGERGSVSVELAILAPIVLLVALLVIAAGRVHGAQQALDHAATAAARAASLARTPAAATEAATAAAHDMLDQHDIACTSRHVTVDTNGFGTRPGTLGLARVTVHCTVPLSQLALPLGDMRLSSRFASPLDPYRAGP